MPLFRNAAATAFLATIAFAPAAMAEEVKHYEAEKSSTLAEAVRNFSEQNAIVSKELAKDTWTSTDIETIHEATYSLELALEEINEAMEELAEKLERVHRLSEKHEEADLREATADYLETAETVIPSKPAAD